MSTELRQLHVSGLNTLSRCGEQFRRRYIEGERIPPAVAMHVGTAVHKSVEANLKARMVGGSLERDQAAEYAFAKLTSDWDRFGVTLDPEEDASPETIRGKALDKAVALSAHHYDKVAPTIEPTHVERRWTLAITGYDFELAGTIDIQEGSKRLRDTKTSGKTPSGNPAAKSIQLPMYVLAIKAHDGAEPESMHLDYLIDLKRGPKLAQYESRPDERDTQVILDRVAAAHKAMEAGVFLPANPDDWWCSDKWCGYWRNCRYARRSQVIPPPTQRLAEIAPLPAPPKPKPVAIKPPPAPVAATALFGPGGIA